MAKDIKFEEDFFKKHLRAPNTSNEEFLKFDTLIKLAVNGHYPLFFPQWISESIENVKWPISSREAKINVTKMLSLIEKHQTIAKKRTALLSFNDRDRNIYIKSFIKLVELHILDHHTSGLH